MSFHGVKLGKYTGVMAYALPKVSADDAEIEEALMEMAAEQSWLEPVDRPARTGDRVTLDFYGTVFGEPFPDGEAENCVLELGKEELLEGFDEQIAGMEPEGEKEVRITFPGDLAPDIAGKPAVFKVKLHEVKELRQPQTDDEWANDLGYDSLADLKDDIRQTLLEEKQAEAYQLYADEMLDRIVGRCRLEVPEDMIGQRALFLQEQFIDGLEDQGITDWEEYVTGQGSSAEYMEEVYFKDMAETELKREMVLDAIAAREGITADEDEIEEAFAQLAEVYDVSEEEIRQLVSADEVSEDIVRQKTVGFLLEHAV